MKKFFGLALLSIVILVWLGTYFAPKLEFLKTSSIHEGMSKYNDSVSERFYLYYPEELTVDIENTWGDGQTVTFQNIEQGKGFQIFIVPYDEIQISDERFKKDIPSAIRTDIKEVMLGDIKGTSFYSKDDSLGETKEIWFIRDGWLYEITTLKPLENWMDEILRTWKFTKK